MMKIGCSMLGFGAMSFDEACKAAKEVGFEYVEPCATMYPWSYPYLTLDEDPREIKNKLEDYGLRASGMSAHGDLVPRAKDCVRHLRKAVRFASEAGIPIINFGEGWLGDYAGNIGIVQGRKISEEEAFQTCKKVMSEVLDEAEKHQVFFAIEPHGHFSSTLEGMRRIQAISPSKYLCVNYDTASTVTYHLSFLKAFLNKVRHVHIKDFNLETAKEEGRQRYVTVAAGKGIVDIKGCIEVLKKAGYDGVLSIEVWDPWNLDDPMETIKQSFQYVKSLL